MDFSHYARFLSHLPIFKGLNPEEIADIARLFKPVQVKAGQEVCREGEPGDAVFVIESGQLEVLKKAEQGDEQSLATLNGPTVVGEMALLDGVERSATVRAKTDVSLYRIERKDFSLLRNEYNLAASKVIRNLGLILAHRLRHTNERVSEFFRDPEKSLKAMQARQKALWQQRLKDRGDV